MAVQPLDTWKTTLAALPKVTDTSWAQNFANWYFSMISGISPDPAAFVPVGFVFTFPTPLFASQLQTLPPVADAVAGITGFANAWETALNGTTIVVGPGSAIPPPSPTTIFSAVFTATIDPPSIAAGKAKLLELVTAPPVANPLDSQFPIKFREATLLLTFTVTGLDSQPPPSAGPGPQPLTASNIPLI